MEVGYLCGDERRTNLYHTVIGSHQQNIRGKPCHKADRARCQRPTRCQVNEARMLSLPDSEKPVDMFCMTPFMRRSRRLHER
jgi:hypothetical protein